MRYTLFALPLVLAAGLMVDKPQAQALNLVCSAAWTGSNIAPGGTSNPTPLAGASSPTCPTPTVNTTVTVGTGANAGVINGSGYNWGTASGSSNYPTTSQSSIDIGAPANTTETLTVTFSQAVNNPLLYFGFVDNNTSFIFSQAFNLLQANNAIKTNSTTIAGTVGSTNSGNDGFTVQVQGTFGPSNDLNLQYVNSTGNVQSVTFTTGVLAAPAPLPLLGAGMAFRFSRRLRRRVQGSN